VLLLLSALRGNLADTVVDKLFLRFFERCEGTDDAFCNWRGNHLGIWSGSHIASYALRADRAAEKRAKIQ